MKKYSSKSIKTVLNEHRDEILAKQSAEFLDEGYYIMESCVALGDYYYNDSSLAKKALKACRSALTMLQSTSLKTNMNSTRTELHSADKLCIPEKSGMRNNQ